MNWRGVWIFLLICAVAMISRCTYSPQYDEFDPEEGLIDVQTQTQYDEKTVINQYTLASGRRIQPVEQFTPDEANFYEAPDDCFESYIDGKVLNRLVRMELLDKNGQPVEITETIENIFQCIEKLEHDLLTVRIIEVDELYFVYVELNVNLWTPCTFYFYNSEKKQLVELYEWNDQEVIALHIRSVDGLLKL